MILEMVGSRVLAPYFGTSIVVWTSLIGIILGCLSLGYWWGGKLADEKPSMRILAFIVLMAAGFIALIALSKSFVLGFLQERTSSLHLASAAATLFLFAPPSILLGTVSPYAVRLKIMDVQHSGKTVGSLYAISTLGSILGTFLAGFFLIGFFGTTNILLVLSVILVITSLLASLRDRLVKLTVMGILLVLFVGSGTYDAYLAGLEFYDMDSHYNRILIYNTTDEATGKTMRVMVTGPRGKQSAMYLDDPIVLACEYTKYYGLAPHFKPDMKKLLMLGGGGYSFPKYALSHYPDARMDVVEIDPRVTALARQFFTYKDDPRINVFHEDARTFLNKTHMVYDVILCDTFSSHYSIPFHLSTRECIEKLYGALVDGGVVFVNILSSIEGDTGRFLRAEYATFKAVFPQVYLFPVASAEDPGRWQNVMLIALKSGKEPVWTNSDSQLDAFLQHRWKNAVPEDLPLLTDEFAPVDRYINVLQ